MPQRSRVVAEGTRSDALNSKEKQRIVAASATTAKRRRNEPHAIPATEEPKGTAVALDEESNAQYPQYNGQDPSAGVCGNGHLMAAPLQHVFLANEPNPLR